jgi:hypothetical protein
MIKFTIGKGYMSWARRNRQEEAGWALSPMHPSYWPGFDSCFHTTHPHPPVLSNHIPSHPLIHNPVASSPLPTLWRWRQYIPTKQWYPPPTLYTVSKPRSQFIHVHISLYSEIVMALRELVTIRWLRRSRWPRGLRHELASPAHTLGSWVRIPVKAQMSMCVYSVCAVLCAGSGRATGWSPVQGVLPTVYKIKKLKQRSKSNKGL